MPYEHKAFAIPELIRRICPIDDNPIPYTGRGRPNVYCTPSCKAVARKIINAAGNDPLCLGNERICAFIQCGERFSVVDAVHDTYCSLKCFNACHTVREALPPGWFMCPNCRKPTMKVYGGQIACSDYCLDMIWTPERLAQTKCFGARIVNCPHTLAHQLTLFPKLAWLATRRDKWRAPHPFCSPECEDLCKTIESRRRDIARGGLTDEQIKQRIEEFAKKQVKGEPQAT